MKKTILIALVFAAASAGLSSCINAHAQEPKTELRQPGQFTGIEVGGAFEVELVQGGECSVKIEVNDGALLEKISTSVSRGVLHVESKGMENVKGKIRLVITAPAFESAELSGAVSVGSAAILKSEKFHLEASGAARVNLNLDAGSMETEISGASQVELKGRSSSAQIEASGASLLQFASLEIGTCHVRASGASSVSLKVSKDLHVNASGASNVTYSGGASVEKNASGAASIGRN